ncbi:hypothetical protein TeGR_g5469 [Tetraparma gracilis]|uniref:Intraflagellar transport protein 46 homolog n=1 Tax=Tetraparma gracilis TaxID=2962635 RepID=A0ABQ6M763_9STRA|nr:hypothetical protein TeGR_g5469 [Tetraparma gracilis]
MSVSDQKTPGPGGSGGERLLKNEQFDEALDVSQSVDIGGTPGTKGTPGKTAYKDKPFDEAVSMSDNSMSDSSVDTNADPPSPKSKQPAQQERFSEEELRKKQDHALGSEPHAQKTTVGHLSPAQAEMEESREETDESESGSDSEDGDESGGEGGTLQVPGAYNPEDYASLDVGGDVREIFDYISRYKPHEVELDTSLKCFIPDYIPAVGEMDAFIKIPTPAGGSDDLGLKVLDEPAASQSDSTVLELQLRAISKKASGEVAVRSIDNAASNPREIQRWITSISELHRSKPPPQVHYKKSMPDVEALMDVWPEEFEDALSRSRVPLPSVNLDLSLEEYIKVWCSLLDVPVYEGSVVESLHVLFTTFQEFKSNQHFMPNQAQGKEGNVMDEDFGSYEFK